MAEQDITLENNDQIEQSAADIIAEMRANTVSKDKYNKAMEENRKLMKALANGESLTPEEAPNTPDLEELKKALFSEDNGLNNLEYIEKALQLRDAVLEAGGDDPFLPYGPKYVPDDNDISTANRVADVLKQCVEYADGDSMLFTNELQRRTVDTAPPRPKRR